MNRSFWPKVVAILYEISSFADEPDKVTFSNRSRRGAVLYLPVDASRQDTLARRDFGRWMIKHIDYWFAFAR